MDYDFIDPDLPEKRAENNDADSDKVGGEDSRDAAPIGRPEDRGEDSRGFLGRAYNRITNAL